MRSTNPKSRRSIQWCHTPTARYADMLVSPLASSTSPPTIFIGQEPSWRWLRSHQAYAASAASTCPATSSAIAASTWFQTSTCSPVVHGTAPSGSCIEAIDAAVCGDLRAGQHAGHRRDRVGTGHGADVSGLRR